MEPFRKKTSHVSRLVQERGNETDICIIDGGLLNWIWRAYGNIATQALLIHKELTMCRFEVNVGIIATCLPALRPGYKWLCQLRHPTRKVSSDHLPLADMPAHQNDGARRESSIHFMPSTDRANGKDAGVSGSDILKTTTIDIEQGF